MARSRLTWLFGVSIIMTPTTRYVPFGIDIGGVVFTLERIFILFCVVLAVVAVRQRPQVRLSYSAVGVLSLLLLLMLSVLWSVAPVESIRRATDLLFYTAFFATLVIYFDRDGSFDILLTLLVIPAVAMVSYAIVNVIASTPAWRLVDGISRNTVSRDMVAVLPPLVLGAYGRRWGQAGLRVLLAGLMVPLVLLSGSRSGLVALVLAVVLVALFWTVRIKELSSPSVTAASAMSVLILAAGVTIAYTAGAVPPRLARLPLISGGISPQTLGQARYQVRLAELGTIRQHPLIGIGYGAFYVYSAEQFGIGMSRAHSLVTRVWMGAGLTGVVILLGTGILVLRNYLRRITNDNAHRSFCIAGCLIGLAATTLTGMFNIVIGQPLFYILVAVGSSTILIDR